MLQGRRNQGPEAEGPQYFGCRRYNIYSINGRLIINACHLRFFDLPTTLCYLGLLEQSVLPEKVVILRNYYCMSEKWTYLWERRPFGHFYKKEQWLMRLRFTKSKMIYYYAPIYQVHWTFYVNFFWSCCIILDRVPSI